MPPEFWEGFAGKVLTGDGGQIGADGGLRCSFLFGGV